MMLDTCMLRTSGIAVADPLGQRHAHDAEDELRDRQHDHDEGAEPERRAEDLRHERRTSRRRSACRRRPRTARRRRRLRRWRRPSARAAPACSRRTSSPPPTGRPSVSYSSCRAVPTEPTSACQPEIAPQAMVTKSIGQSGCQALPASAVKPRSLTAAQREGADRVAGGVLDAGQRRHERADGAQDDRDEHDPEADVVDRLGEAPDRQVGAQVGEDEQEQHPEEVVRQRPDEPGGGVVRGRGRALAVRARGGMRGSASVGSVTLKSGCLSPRVSTALLIDTTAAADRSLHQLALVVLVLSQRAQGHRRRASRRRR